MYLAGLGSATPAQRYTQADWWDAFTVSPWFERLDCGRSPSLDPAAENRVTKVGANQTQCGLSLRRSEGG